MSYSAANRISGKHTGWPDAKQQQTKRKHNEDS